MGVLVAVEVAVAVAVLVAVEVEVFVGVAVGPPTVTQESLPPMTFQRAETGAPVTGQAWDSSHMLIPGIPWPTAQLILSQKDCLLFAP